MTVPNSDSYEQFIACPLYSEGLIMFGKDHCHGLKKPMLTDGRRWDVNHSFPLLKSQSLHAYPFDPTSSVRL